MKILIVEDEVKLGHSIKKGLEQEGYTADLVDNGERALSRIIMNLDMYDLVLLDGMLPGKDGLDVLQAVREKGLTILVIMLTARDTKRDIVAGLNEGADDYIVKPFSFEELLARIRALSRRPKKILQRELTTKDLRMNPTTRKAFLKDKEIVLTMKEFNILEFLMRHAGEVVNRDQLLSHVWDFAFDSFSNVVDVHIKNLRKKINIYDELLETVRGVGYRLKA